MNLDPVCSTSKEDESLGSSAKENDLSNEVALARTHLEDDTSECSRDGLVGTSEERKKLIDRLNANYQASLAVDREKKVQREARDRREALRVSRKNRVLY